MIVSIFFWCEMSFSFCSSVDFVCFGVDKFFLWARDSFLRCEILLPSPLSFPLNMVHVAYDRRTGDAVPIKGARLTVNRWTSYAGPRVRTVSEGHCMVMLG
jgi:hypothetical protein